MFLLMLQVEPEHLRFGGGAAETAINPLIAIAILVAGILIVAGSRRSAIVAFLAVSILIPTDQVAVIAGLHFPVMRILIVFGLIRMLREKLLSKMEIFSGGINGIDIALILLTVFTAINGVLLWQITAQVVFQLGSIYSAFGLYFLTRFLIRDELDVRQVISSFAYILGVLALLMVYERATGHNPAYSFLGGARAATYMVEIGQDQRIRAMGTFAHPILAGTFGAILFPLSLGMWWKFRQNRAIALIGIVSSLIIPFTANSSTCLIGLFGGAIALCSWPFRKWMRPMRWAIAITLVALHLVMKAPVWHLISRIDLTGSSSSYHRYELVNQCILHFREWFLIGTKNYANWDWSMYDLSNQYVAVADPSGLIPLLCLIAMIVFGFKYLGRARKAVERDRQQELFIWAIGASLFANVVAFFGVSYFDQTVIAWYALLAVISAVTLAARKAQTEPQQEPQLQKPWHSAQTPRDLAPFVEKYRAQV